ncbi:hypothetical protein PG993_015059 [Apiospora rasikravindrae]|uniref:Uncharacterized protein n=1 Tax=Apiospora rasikravindrae TaxID=990691 RepID=A0ABR1RPK5_9PEZI
MRELAFVSADPHGKPKASDRKLIRSHCMKEKNRRIGARKVNPASPKGQAAIAPNHPSRDDQGKGAQHPAHRSRSRRAPPFECIKLSCTGYQPSQLKAVLAAFAYKVDGAALELLQRSNSTHTVLTTFKRTVTHRFQDCVSFEPYQTVNMTWLLEDEAYLHSVLLVASTMWEDKPINLNRGCQQSTRTSLYMNKTLASLREGLSSTNTTNLTEDHPGLAPPAANGSDGQELRSLSSSLRDSRISVVATLVILSTLVGDTRALQAHVAGLTQMVRLRGGMSGIRKNPALYAKLRRVDVLWSLYCGETSLFISSQHQKDQKPRSYEPPPDTCLSDQHPQQQRAANSFQFGSPLVSPPAITKQISQLQSPPRKTLQTLIGCSDDRLLAIFRAQQAISHKLNAALSTGHPLAETEFRDLVSESQCGLVALRGRCVTIPAECLRLALLVILTTTMNLPSPAQDGSPLAEEDEARKQDGMGPEIRDVRPVSRNPLPTPFFGSHQQGNGRRRPRIRLHPLAPPRRRRLPVRRRARLAAGAVAVPRGAARPHVLGRGRAAAAAALGVGRRGARRAGAAGVRGADVWAAEDDDSVGAARA